MDFLSSLNVPSLPEQQTRTAHNARITEILTSNPNVRLGFDACCNCGVSLSGDLFSCPRCQRVSYCSDRCRKEDANASHTAADTSNVEEDSAALGHSSIICSLLRLCNADEEQEERMEERQQQQQHPKKVSKKNLARNDDDDAEFRVRSECESYPATLANIVMDGACFQSALKHGTVVSSRRVSSKRNSDTSDGRAVLSIHVVGASEEAELWGNYNNDLDRVFDSYAEALTELVETHSLSTVQVAFVGPQCPTTNKKGSRFVDDATTTKTKKKVCFTTYHSEYNREFLLRHYQRDLLPPDIVIFFNPGFTCPDYAWDDTLSCIMSSQQSQANKRKHKGVPFLVTTNTEMEAVMDCQYLLEQDRIPVLPAMIRQMVRLEEDEHDSYESDEEDDHNDSDDHGMFFGENPYAGSRVRQSGTMANDLFVKNKFMFGGYFVSSGDISSAPGIQNKSSTKKKRRVDENTENSNALSKKHKSAGKKRNPALI